MVTFCGFPSFWCWPLLSALSFLRAHGPQLWMGTLPFLQGALEPALWALAVADLVLVVREVGEGQGPRGQPGTSNFLRCVCSPIDEAVNDRCKESGQPAQRCVAFMLSTSKRLQSFKQAVFTRCANWASSGVSREVMWSFKKEKIRQPVCTMGVNEEVSPNEEVLLTGRNRW